MKANQPSASILTRFSACAPTYHSSARVQQLVADQLIKLMPHDAQPDPILEIGCGTGILTHVLHQRFASSQIHALDLSASMIAQNQAQFPQDSNITWYTEDIRYFESPMRFLLVVSNCALHWLESLETGFRHIHNLTAPGGTLVTSIMVHGTLAELHEMRTQIAPHKIPLGRLPEMNVVLSSLKKVGFSIDLFDDKTYTMHYPSALSMLRILHDTGVTGGSVSQAHQLLNRTELNRIIESYDASYSDNQGVRATYRALFIVARR